MKSELHPYEKFLRFEQLTSAADLIRGRAIMITGGVFILIQLVNIIIMMISYGEWTKDHNVATFAIFAIIVLVNGMRYTKNFSFYSLILTAVLLGGVAMASRQVGINSALLPLIVFGCVVNGFIGGWKHLAIYTFAALALIWYMFSTTLSGASEFISGDTLYVLRIFQRAMQASLTVILVSICCGFISTAMNNLFSAHEKHITEMEEAMRERAEYLTYVSSELTLPIKSIYNTCQHFALLPLTVEQKKKLELTEKCSRRLAQITADVRNVADLEAGRVEIESKAFNLRELITSVTDAYLPTAKLKGVHMGVTYAAQLPDLYVGDQKRLKQVFNTLISNAVKNTSSGSVHIYVNGRLIGAEDVRLSFSIRDTGTGIAKADLWRVFRLFDKPIDGLARQENGGRAALPISYGFIKAMGGDITADSNNGDGSNFEITLTLKAAKPA